MCSLLAIHRYSFCAERAKGSGKIGWKRFEPGRVRRKVDSGFTAGDLVTAGQFTPVKFS
jgi:hypothetical protein